MKKFIKRYVFIFSILIALLLVFSLILVLIKYNSSLSFKTMKLISLIGSSILFLLVSLLYGKLNKKRGLINGIIMTSIYLFFVLVISLFNIEITISSIIIKSILIIIGNVLGVNI